MRIIFTRTPEGTYRARLGDDYTFGACEFAATITPGAFGNGGGRRYRLVVTTFGQSMGEPFDSPTLALARQHAARMFAIVEGAAA